MSYFKELLLTNWHAMRVIRLVIGVAFVIGYFVNHEWVMLLAGGLFLFQAVFNAGCQSCAAPPRYNGSVQDVKDIDYEEIK